MNLKNEDEFTKQLSQDFAERYSLCKYKPLEVSLFIRRLNNMGYVVVKSEDLIRFEAHKDKKIKKIVVPWIDRLSNFKKKFSSGSGYQPTESLENPIPPKCKSAETNGNIAQER